MSKDPTTTVQIQKVAKVAPGLQGRRCGSGRSSRWNSELVSTTALERIMKTEGGKTRSEIQRLAAGRRTASSRDTATGHFGS
jgi:hypothetical protein